MLQHRQIQSRQNYETSIREFAKLFYPRIKGATDIDFLYERNGKLLMMEGKHVDSGIITITYGQYKALLTLSQNCKNMTTYLVGETPLGYYVCPIQHVILGLYDKATQEYSIDTLEWKYYPRKQFVEFVGRICDSFEQT